MKLFERMLRGLISKAVVTQVEQGGVEYFQLVGTSIDERAEHFGIFGIASATPVGCEVVRVRAKAAPNIPLVVGVAARQYRPQNLAPGDTCLYNAAGDRVWLKNSRELVADVDGATVTVKGDSIKLQVGSVTLEVKATGVEIVSPTGTSSFH